MKSTFVLAAAFVVGAATPWAHARKQVLQNGSFEIGILTEQMGCANSPLDIPEFWNQFGCAERSMDFAFDGDASFLGSLRENNFIGAFQDPVEVGEGVRVLMRTMTYVPSSAPLTGNAVGGIKLEFRQPVGIKVPPPEENLQFNVDDAIFAEDTWVTVSYMTTVPDDIDIARIILINFDNSAVNGPVYADAAVAEVSSAPGVNQLLNASFENGTSGANGLDNWIEFASPASGARKNAFEVPAVNGLNVAKFLGMTAGLRQDIIVNSGDTLTISAQFRSRSAMSYADMDAFAGVKVEWIAGSVPAPNIDIAPNANPISATTNIVTSMTPTDEWVPVTIDYTMPPATAALLRATVISGFGPGTSDVYYDAFEFVLANVFDGSDADGDDDEDLHDIAALQKSFTGSGGGLIFCGLVNDQDEDEDVDLSDADFILQRITGPAVPMP